MPAAARSRPFDITLWGATGFTGRLVAQHLVRTRADGDLRLALGGRNRDKLEALRAELAQIDPAAADLPLVVADSFDREALRAMAAQATVVCTTVGPYAKYGADLVAACVAEGTHYCDLTGEVPFIRAMIDEHHDAAVEKGVRIVSCCGFDSIPSDLGVWMMQSAMKERHGVHATDVKLGVAATKGGFSGGTVASMLEIAQQVRRDPKIRRVLGNPYGLDPKGGPRLPDSPDPKGVSRDHDLDAWTAPFVMAGINTRIVRRSNALLDYTYGTDFRYTEVMSFRPNAKGFARAASVTGAMVGFLGAVAIDPTRALLERFVLPSPGEGPSADEREAGYFKMRLWAKAEVDGTPIVLRGRVEGDKDPGYGQTSIMLGESARCLAIDSLDSPGGITTPAAAMGDALLARLRGAGMVFAVDA